jgi:hypothetical protein
MGEETGRVGRGGLTGLPLQLQPPRENWEGRGVAPGKHKKSTRPHHAPAPPPAAAPAFCWSWKVRRARRTFAPAPRCSVAMARCTAGVRDTPADPRWGPRALKLDVLAEVCAGRAVHAHVNTDAHRREKGCGAACRGEGRWVGNPGALCPLFFYQDMMPPRAHGTNPAPSSPPHPARMDTHRCCSQGPRAPRATGAPNGQVGVTHPPS